jgi:hypothetical protein
MPTCAVGDDGKLEIIGIVVEVEARPRIDLLNDDARFGLIVIFVSGRVRRMAR